MTRAVVLLSGGLDSATTLAIAKAHGHRVYALSFDYGQRHKIELEAAERVRVEAGVADHRVVSFDLRGIGGSSLTSDLAVPHHGDASKIPAKIPSTYVPARNAIFLSFALAWAEVLDATVIYVGVNALDYSGYPDCRGAFLEAFEAMANLATRAGVEGRRIHLNPPLLHMTKADIIRAGLSLGVDYGLTWSCYDPSPAGLSCGQCDACLLRLKGFKEVGVPDPLRYAT